MPESIGCGRTDTGVHATQFYVHADLPEIENKEEFIYKLNKILPNDIAIQKIYTVNSDAHARFDALMRSYRYFISRVKDPFMVEDSWYYHGSLDINAMQKACELILNNKDYTSFAKTGADVNNYLCDVKECYFETTETLLVFNITANRFVRNMVRAITGTLVEVGRGKLNLEELQVIFDKKDRSSAGFSAPAQGLFLTRVIYPENIFKEDE